MALTILSVTNAVSASANGVVEITVPSIPDGALVLVMSQAYGLPATNGCSSPSLGTFTRQVATTTDPSASAFTAVRSGTTLTNEVVTVTGAYNDMHNSASAIVLTDANTSTFNTSTVNISSGTALSISLTGVQAGSWVFGNFCAGGAGATSATPSTGTTELQDQYLSASSLETWGARCTDKPATPQTVTIEGTLDGATTGRMCVIEIRDGGGGSFPGDDDSFTLQMTYANGFSTT